MIKSRVQWARIIKLRWAWQKKFDLSNVGLHKNDCITFVIWLSKRRSSKIWSIKCRKGRDWITEKLFSKTWLYLTVWFHFWLDSDLDVDALSEERRRLLAICSWRFSLASCLKKWICLLLARQASNYGDNVYTKEPFHCLAQIKHYLHPLCQQLGVLRSLLLVLLGALSLEGNAAALVLQHARSHQSLDPGSFSSRLFAWRKARYNYLREKKNLMKKGEVRSIEFKKFHIIFTPP